MPVYLRDVNYEIIVGLDEIAKRTGVMVTNEGEFFCTGSREDNNLTVAVLHDFDSDEECKEYLATDAAEKVREHLMLAVIVPETDICLVILDVSVNESEIETDSFFELLAGWDEILKHTKTTHFIKTEKGYEVKRIPFQRTKTCLLAKTSPKNPNEKYKFAGPFERKEFNEISFEDMEEYDILLIRVVNPDTAYIFAIEK